MGVATALWPSGETELPEGVAHPNQIRLPDVAQRRGYTGRGPNAWGYTIVTWTVLSITPVAMAYRVRLAVS